MIKELIFFFSSYKLIRLSLFSLIWLAFNNFHYVNNYSVDICKSVLAIVLELQLLMSFPQALFEQLVNV